MPFSKEPFGSLSTFGFRGEALSSICAVAELQITTRANNDLLGTRLHFEETGKLQSFVAVAHPQGTSAVVKDLFRKVPVRKKALETDIIKEYNSALTLTLIRNYACMSIGVRFKVNNTRRLASRAYA